jgi:hypothetical protein
MLGGIIFSTLFGIIMVPVLYIGVLKLFKIDIEHKEITS